MPSAQCRQSFCVVLTRDHHVRHLHIQMCFVDATGHIVSGMSEEELVLCIPQSDNLSALPAYMNDHVTVSGDVRRHRKTEAKDQITEQTNKYARNGRRRYREPSESLFKTDSVESKVEKEMLSVKMRLAKAICRNKFGDDTAEKFVSDDATKAIAETTQLLENVGNTQDAKSGASSQRGAYTGALQREREGSCRPRGTAENSRMRPQCKVGVKAACVAQEGGRLDLHKEPRMKTRSRRWILRSKMSRCKHFR